MFLSNPDLSVSFVMFILLFWIQFPSPSSPRYAVMFSLISMIQLTRPYSSAGCYSVSLQACTVSHLCLELKGSKLLHLTNVDVLIIFFDGFILIAIVIFPVKLKQELRYTGYIAVDH